MKNIIGILIFALLPMSVSAGLITFNLAGDSGDGAEGRALDGLEIGTVTKGGVSATLSTFVSSGNDWVLNQTSSSFGVNRPGDGCDSSAELDSNCGHEKIFISFSQIVELVSITLTNYSSNDIAEIQFANSAENPRLVISSSPSTTYINRIIDDAIFIGSAGGNGFSVDRFTIATVDVPEPATLTLLGLGLLGLGVTRKSRK